MRPTFNKWNGDARLMPSPGDREMKDIRATDKALKMVDARLASDSDDFAGWLKSSPLVGASATTKTCIMLRLRGRVSPAEMDACREALCL